MWKSVLIAVFFCFAISLTHSKPLHQYVNLDMGTRSTYEFSRGNLLPISSYKPFAFNHFAEMTSNTRGSWWYHPEDKVSGGILLNHQPSPWIDNYAGVLFAAPQVGERMDTWSNMFSYVNQKTKTKLPNELGIDYVRYGTRLNLTPSERGGIIKIQWPKYEKSLPQDQRRRFVLMVRQGYAQINGNVMTGYTSSNSGGVPSSGMSFYFHVEIEKGKQFIREMSMKKLRQPHFQAPPHPKMSQANAQEYYWSAFFIEIDPETSGQETIIKFGTSFISQDQAKIAMQREVSHMTYDELKQEAAAQWDDALGRIKLPKSTDQDKKKFYSIFYRGLQFPRNLTEIDANGNAVHWSPYNQNGGTYPGLLTVDQGFWDAYRTSYSFWSVVFPDSMAKMMDGWFASCTEGGWYPRWSSPGYRAVMPATASNVVVADSVLKGIGSFDKEKAYQCLKKDAYESPPPEMSDLVGRKGIKDYIKYGYVPSDYYDESVSRTLSFGFEDFALSQYAKYLGHESDYQDLYNRSIKAYQNVYHSGSRFMTARQSTGHFVQNLDPFQYGSPYTEGNAWQFSLSVPHDIPGLAKLHGGNEKIVELLDTITQLNQGRFRVGHYGNEIHEMAENSELSLNGFGQLGFNNQPGHHLTYVYSKVGAPHKTQYWTQKIYNELYTDRDFPGDEDNGEMALWGVLSSLGFFQLTPSTTEYLVTIPAFPEIHVVRGQDAGVFVIERQGPMTDLYIDHVEVDGKTLETYPTISYHQLMSCKRLKFVTTSSSSTAQ